MTKCDLLTSETQKAGHSPDNKACVVPFIKSKVQAQASTFLLSRLPSGSLPIIRDLPITVYNLKLPCTSFDIKEGVQKIP